MLRIAFGLLFVFSLSSPVVAQALRPTLQEANQGNWVIRAVSIHDSVGPGRVRSIGADSVRIGDSSVAIANIIRIDREVRVGGGAVRGALLGGGILGLFAFSLSNAFCRPECSVMQLAGGVAIGATVGFSIGAMVGGLTNPSTRAWTQLWPGQ